MVFFIIIIYVDEPSSNTNLINYQQKNYTNWVKATDYLTIRYVLLSVVFTLEKPKNYVYNMTDIGSNLRAD